MEEVTLLSYSHTDYKDIWDIVINEYIKNNIQIKNRIFAINETNLLEDEKKKLNSFFSNIIFYNDHQTYPQKLIYILQNINTKYVLLIHDIDICINFESIKFNSLMNCIIKNNIDRLILGMIQPQNEIITDNDIFITCAHNRNISKNFYTPYDVGPSIWKKETLINSMNAFNNYSYRDIENSGIQDYLTSKRIYAITRSSNYDSHYQIGRPFSTYFKFLHILVRGKWFESKYYMDLSENFDKIIKEYNIDISKRGLNDSNVHNFLLSLKEKI
jgi:hypothetical protein